MKLSGWQWLAASSLLVGALASAETRPQYGGTLRVTMQAALSSLDPADRSVPDSFARRGLTLLLFDTLVVADGAGHPQPWLAESWQTASGNHRWHFRIRRNVKFQDGSALTAESAAASLRFANPSWNVSTDGDSVVIERDGSDAALFAELALARNAIVKRNTDGSLSGTGPFRALNWHPGSKVALAADENYWRGRPFLDGIEFEMGKNFRDQMSALQAGGADLVEVAPEQAQHFPLQGRILLSSPPLELVTLDFSTDATSPEEKALREALGLSIERGSMRDVLLRGAGRPAGSILPNWISGYGFVFSSAADLARARQLRPTSHAAPVWKLGYNSNDPTDRLLAERIALNAKDAGLSVQPTTGSAADVRLVRIPLQAGDPGLALTDALAQAGMSSAKDNGGAREDLYAAESAALAAQRLIPLFHLPVAYASSVSAKNWRLRPDGGLDLADAWIEPSKP